MAQGDGGYSLPTNFTKDNVLQIFGYSSTEELEQFLRKCPRHYLRNYFAEVYLGSADRVHEIRSNNDKYLLNKLVQAIRAAGIPVDVGGRRQANKSQKAKVKQERPEEKPQPRDSPQKSVLPRQSGRTQQPATFSLVARAGPGLTQPMPGALNGLLQPSLLAGGAWGPEAAPNLQQLAQLQAMMQQQQMMLPGWMQYYQSLLPALSQMQGLLGPHIQLQQEQLQQLAALQGQIPALVTDAAPLSLPPLAALPQPSPLLTGLGSADPAEPGSPEAKPRAGSRSTATDPSRSREWTEDGSGCSGDGVELPPGADEADTSSDSDLQGWKRPTNRKLSGSKRPAKGRKGAAKLKTQKQRKQGPGSSLTATPEPMRVVDDSATAFQALLSAVEAARQEEA